VLATGTLFGSPARVREQVAELRDVGVRHLLCQTGFGEMKSRAEPVVHAPLRRTGDAGVRSVSGFQQAKRVLDLILGGARAGVGVEILHRLIGDGGQVVTRDVQLPQPGRHADAHVKHLQRVSDGERGLSGVHVAMPDAQSLRHLPRRARIDLFGKPDFRRVNDGRRFALSDMRIPHVQRGGDCVVARKRTAAEPPRSVVLGAVLQKRGDAKIDPERRVVEFINNRG